MAAKRTDGPHAKKKRGCVPTQHGQLKKQRSRQGKEGAASAKERGSQDKDGGPAKPVSKKANIDSGSRDIEQPSVLVAYQRCRAVRWRPQPVVAMSVCPDQSAVAVARDNGTIELWNSNTWTLIMSVPGMQEASITALCWVWDTITSMWRLFSCGLDTLIVEWQLQQRKPLHVASSLGGAAWHMAAQPQNLLAQSSDTSDVPDPLVAVATDDGTVRLHTVEPSKGGMQFRKAVAHADARALHVLWRDDGAVLFAAFSNGCISILDVSTGTETLRITAATHTGGQPACIWSLATLPGGLLASASSRGVVQTFETQFGTQQSSCHHHQADVTCLAASPCGGNLFAAGVDPSLVLLTPSQPAGSDSDAPARFQFSDRRRPHGRDVRAMAVVTPRSRSHKSKASGASAKVQQQAERPSWLLTGSNDAQLLVHSAQTFQSQHAARVTAAPCAPVLAFSACGRFIAADGESIDVWQPADAPAAHEKGKSVAQEGEPISANTPPWLLARLVTDPDRAPVAAAISPCGSFAASSTSECTTLLAISEAPGGIAAVRMQEPLPPACSLCFLHSSRKDQEESGECCLLLGCMDGSLLCLHVDVTCDGALRPPVKVLLPEENILRQAASLQRCSNPACNQLQPPFTHIVSSPCGRTVAVSTPNAVHILHWQDTKQSEGLLVVAGTLAMPHSPSARPITAIALAPSRDVVAISTTDVRLELYDSSTFMQLDWLQNTAGVTAKLDTLNGHVHGLCFRPSESVSVGVPLGGVGIVKPSRHLGRPSFVGDAAGTAMRVMDAGGVVLGAEWVSQDCFLLVQGSWDDVGDTLPPPLMLKLYGA